MSAGSRQRNGEFPALHFLIGRQALVRVKQWRARDLEPMARPRASVADGWTSACACARPSIGELVSNIVIVTETGSDITASEAAELGIELVPMHVSIGDATIDDGTLDSAEMLEECRQLGVLPRTSGSMPADFSAVFDRIHEANPEAHILYIAYSASTTCSFESARTAAEGRGYVSMFDTGHVTIGLALVVRKTVEHLRENPDITVEELLEWSQAYAKRVRMGFLPGDLGYLRAGGRLSNAAFVGATLLRIKPIIELLDGRLVATKKLRGKMASCSLEFMEHMIAGVPADTSTLFFVRSCGLPLAIQQAAEQRAREMGFEELRWYDTQNVITSHCGPGSFGVAFAAEE